MLLMSVFAVIALGLAALGIYSVLSYAVNQRRQELSVRMALGAQPRDVLWLVVRQGLGLTLLGAAVGAFGAFALGRTLSSLLYGVSSGDTLAFAAAVITRDRHRARRLRASGAPRGVDGSTAGTAGGLRVLGSRVSGF